MSKYIEESPESYATRATRLVEKLEAERKGVEDGLIMDRSLDIVILEHLSKSLSGESDNDIADEDISRKALDFVLKSRGINEGLSSTSSSQDKNLESTLAGDVHDLLPPY